MSKEIIKSTKEGRLYIKNEDFFKQESIKSQIEELKQYELIKSLEG